MSPAAEAAWLRRLERELAGIASQKARSAAELQEIDDRCAALRMQIDNIKSGRFNVGCP
jgi:hypothetical protein